MLSRTCLTEERLCMAQVYPISPHVTTKPNNAPVFQEKTEVISLLILVVYCEAMFSSHFSVILAYNYVNYLSEWIIERQTLREFFGMVGSFTYFVSFLFSIGLRLRTSRLMLTDDAVYGGTHLPDKNRLTRDLKTDRL